MVVVMDIYGAAWLFVGSLGPSNYVRGTLPTDANYDRRRWTSAARSQIKCKPDAGDVLELLPG